MNPGRFYMPGYMGIRNASISSPMLRMANSASGGMGLFSRIANGVRSVNWSGILSNANKTLNVVNQAIPLVRQAGPMVSNMRSMLRIAKVFGSETTSSNIKNNTSKIVNTNHNINNNVYSDKEMISKNDSVDDGYPNFFV